MEEKREVSEREGGREGEKVKTRQEIASFSGPSPQRRRGLGTRLG